MFTQNKITLMKIVLLFCLILFSGCRKSKTPPPPSISFPVHVAKAIKKDTPLYLEAIGHVESVNEVEVKSRIEGELTGVYFNQGDFVKKGDLLFTIDPRPYEAELKKAEAILQENTANLKLSQDKVVRYSSLLQEDYFSEIDFEELQTNTQVYDALVKQNQADIENAKINLDYCWIYSPIDGKTGILQIDQGNLVQPSADETLISLQQICPIFVTFSLPEKDLPQIKKKQTQEMKVLASYDAFKKTTFDGCLYMIDNAVDRKTGMVKLRALFQNKKLSLWPGQFVRTRLILNILKGAILIPAEAVVYTQHGSKVYVIKDSRTAEMRSVTLGQRQDDLIIVYGIQENEEVVTEGLINLYQGASVRVISEKKPLHKSSYEESS